MNYRHAFHAGNFADVVKHLAVVAILMRLRNKAAGFAVIDTHAGSGLYNLAGDEARRGGEATGGIARIQDMTDGPELLQRYLGLVRSCGTARYPGSPLIAAKLLREQDRLVAIEKHPEDHRALADVLAPFRRAKALEADGYARLGALLPPPERRGLVLIDPPYEAPNEFAQAAQAVRGALRRFATGIVAIWFPIKSPPAAEAFLGEILLAGPAKAIKLSVAVDAPAPRLSTAGLAVINPPFGLAQDMTAVLEHIAARLGGAHPARFEVDWIAGGE